MVIANTNVEVFMIFLGGFLGCLANLIAKYRTKAGEFRNIWNYITALILSFAIYGLYYYLNASGYIPAGFNLLALFGFAVLLGYALDEIAQDIVSLIKK